MTALAVTACARNDLSLGETSSEVLTAVAEGSNDFGTIALGSTSGAITIRVAQSGVADAISSVTAVSENCPNFSVVPGSLPRDVYKFCNDGGGGPIPVAPGDDHGDGVTAQLACNGGYDFMTYSFPVYFTPTVAGTQSCVVSITTDNSGVKTVTVTGNGLAPPREIELSRTSVAFGDVRTGQASAPQALVVKNLGSAALTIQSATVSGSGFSMTGAIATIEPNGSYPYQLVCTPATAATLAGTFTIVSDDPDEGTLTVPLSCRGIASALDVQPSPIAFPAARLDEPRELDIALKNSGTAPMMVTAVSVTGTDLEMVTAPTGAIPVNGSMVARVRYLAREEATVAGALTVAFDGTTRTVQISANAKKASLSLTPDGEIDLGAVCVGSTKTQDFSALGAGGAGFAIDDVAVTGDGFALLSSPGPIVISGAGVSAALQVTAQPATAGTMAGTLTLTTDIPNEGTRTVALSGTGITAGVGAAPASYNFGSVLVDEPSQVQEISIANCSGDLLTISGATIEGVDAADFRIITQLPSVVAAADTASMLIEMRPRTLGDKVATLTINHSTGVTEVPLSGDGFIPYVKPERIGTYYACSTGSGAGGWLLALGVALWFSRRRRR